MFAAIIEEIKRRENAGKKLRKDWFLSSNISNKEKAEVLENILITSRKEVEEKKLSYMANLFANICFDTCNLAESHQLIKAAEELSYRQMCLLNVIGLKNGLRNQNYKNEKISNQLVFLLFEYYDLWKKEYLGIEGIPGITNINPNKTKIQGLGLKLYRFMEIDKIPKKDTDEIYHLLR